MSFGLSLLVAGSSSGKSGGHHQSEAASGPAAAMIDMLEVTLWQRQLGSLPEETVGALVAQVRCLSVGWVEMLGGGAVRTDRRSGAFATQEARPPDNCQHRLNSLHCAQLCNTDNPQIFEGIRDFIVQAVELKFNCFFLMPLVDTFPQVGFCVYTERVLSKA